MRPSIRLNMKLAFLRSLEYFRGAAMKCARHETQGALMQFDNTIESVWVPCQVESRWMVKRSRTPQSAPRNPALRKARFRAQKTIENKKICASICPKLASGPPIIFARITVINGAAAIDRSPPIRRLSAAAPRRPMRMHFWPIAAAWKSLK